MTTVAVAAFATTAEAVGTAAGIIHVDSGYSNGQPRRAAIERCPMPSFPHSRIKENCTMAESDAAQFFTWGSLLTLAGAAGATLVVTNTLKTAFDFSPKWIGLVVAQTVCVGTAFYLGKSSSDYVIAILNGCLVYLSAAGASAAGGAIANPTVTASSRSGNVLPPNRSPQSGSTSRTFFSSWF